MTSNVYRDQLSSLSHGIALWDPNPPKEFYDRVSIGDVGYLHSSEGTFIRLFNVMLSWDDPLNHRVGVPEAYEPLNCGPFANTLKRQFDRTDHYSRFVSADTNADNMQAMRPDDADGVTYKFKNRGALLSLPNGGYREEVIRTKVFEDYIRDHVDIWFNWAQKNKLGVERMEDLILVSSCTLVTSWAAAAFVDYNMEAEISLASRALNNGGASFVWNKIRGAVEHRNSLIGPEPIMDQCVFIKGFRAKRVFFWGRRIRAAAEPLPDDPDNSRDDEIQVTRAPGVPKYRDPLSEVLHYISEKCRLDDTVAEDTIAVAHDDDLQFIEDVETLTADTVKEYLREKQIPLLIEKGTAILRDPRDNEPPVSEEKKATFYATAELNGDPVPVVIHPALTKYNLKLEMSESVDQDYDLPKEELTSSAVYPPMLSLKLENCEGYPHTINVEASNEGVTVQDVVRTIHEDLRTPFSKRELSNLRDERRAEVRNAFKERCETEEERSKGPHRIDYLGGRDRLQILPKLTSDGTLLPILSSQAAESLSQSKVAGPSRIPA